MSYSIITQLPEIILVTLGLKPSHIGIEMCYTSITRGHAAVSETNGGFMDIFGITALCYRGRFIRGYGAYPAGLSGHVRSLVQGKSKITITNCEVCVSRAYGCHSVLK